jgi:UDP-N-acetylglucosamine--N-acetylmuramyl-(pentapeptide) pyrophosphoryl-undecaprenol N-acetylglucosamine transferase
VPYPHAAANHQELNAQTLVEAGAAVMVKDADLDVKALSTIKEILVNNATQQSMGEKSSRLGKPNAGKEIAQKILALGFSKS